MYYITYQHVLQDDKTMKDFQAWLKRTWPMQKRWGAQFVKCWIHPENSHILNCRYAVNNLKEWNQNNMKQGNGFFTKKLSEIVQMNRISVTISPYRKHVVTEVSN